MEIKAWLMYYLSQASTWRGLALLLAYVGVELNDAATDYLVQTGLGIAGLISVFWEKS